VKKSITVFHWLPRILCIIAILFISVFALDAFAPGLTIWQQIGGFLIHLIPSFVLLAFLVLAWKREYVGGIIFIIIGIVSSLFIFVHNYEMNDSIWMSLGIVISITVPFLLVGILFLLSHFQKKKLN